MYSGSVFLMHYKYLFGILNFIRCKKAQKCMLHALTCVSKMLCVERSLHY